VSAFAGFGDGAVEFYDGLLADNSRAYWTDQREVYESDVRGPMTALLADLEPEFGAGKVFRPYRDVRFAADKTPYKTHQGAFVAVGPATGWYVQISSPGVRVGAGYYHAGGPDLARIRTAIDTEHSGEELAGIIAKLRKEGFEISGEQLKTSPRGYSVDHPRIDLLRYKSMVVGKSYGFENLDSPKLATRVRTDWRALRPLVDWVAARVDNVG